jgi:hypothetical protein
MLPEDGYPSRNAANAFWSRGATFNGFGPAVKLPLKAKSPLDWPVMVLLTPICR